MANELIINFTSGNTLYALLINSTGEIWDGDSFVTPASADWLDYDLAMSEVATATGIYRVTMPAAAAGVYSFVVRKQAGASPAVSDITVGVGRIEWSGTAEIVPASATNVSDVWSAATRTLTQTGASLAAVVAGTALTIQRGDTTTISLTALGNISARTKLWFSVKDATNDADSASILFVEETAGLTVVNAAAYTTVAHGAIVVTDAVTGAATITINAAVTAQLIPDVPYMWDVQMLTASGVTTLTYGDARVTADVTRAVA